MNADVVFVALPLPLVSLMDEQHLWPGYRYMVSMLRHAGYSAEILYPEVAANVPVDAYFCTCDAGARSDLAASLVECLFRQIRKMDCKILGLSPAITNVEIMIPLLRRLRAHSFDAHIVLGGHLATFSHRKLLSDYDCVDSVVRGEGEYTIVDLARRITCRQTLEGVAGLSYRNGKDIVVNGSRSLVGDLDELPFPATDHIGQLIVRAGGQPFWMRVCCSRGCAGRCTFCSIRAFYSVSGGARWRSRSPKNIVDEVELLHRSHGIDHFVFGADSFWCGSSSRKLRYACDIAREIVDRGVKIRFQICARADDLDRAGLETLMGAGLTDVEIGIESTSQRALDSMGKGTTVEQNEAALRLLKALGLRVRVDFIFHEPFTTVEEARQNHEFQKKCWLEGLDMSLYSKLILADGFPVTELLRKDGLLRGDFPLYEFQFDDPGVAVLERVHREIWLMGHHLLSSLPPSMSAALDRRSDTDERAMPMRPVLAAVKQRFEYLKIVYYARLLSLVESSDRREIRWLAGLLEEAAEPWVREIESVRTGLQSVYTHLLSPGGGLRAPSSEVFRETGAWE